MTLIYHRLIYRVMLVGEEINTRGEDVVSESGVGALPIYDFLITTRKTQWRTALKELEWFLSGEDKCPEGVLRDVWWKGQLNQNDELLHGYPYQLRGNGYNQVEALIESIKKHPNSRRLVLSVWNPEQMNNIATTNGNAMTPAACHLVWTQFSVRDGKLHMNTVFRSTDIVCGLPHNIIQHRALQLYIASRCGLEAASMYKLFISDAHIYKAHFDFALDVAGNMDKYNEAISSDPIDLIYNPTSTEFLSKDFALSTTEIPDPIWTEKVKRTL